MTTQLLKLSSRIARCAANQGARSTAVQDPPAVFEKSARDPKPKLLKCKNPIVISTFNVRILKTINQIPELVANSTIYKVDIICDQKHRIFHDNNELEYKDVGGRINPHNKLCHKK